MPTTRPRHFVTETDHVAELLDAAAQRWPEDHDRRAKLLLHLVERGHQALMEEAEHRRQDRLAAIHQTSGVLADAYPKGYLEELRADWPE